MSYRETDPVKRVRLHAARSILMGIDSLITFAAQHAREGGCPEAVTLIRRAQGNLRKAVDEVIVERLATNDLLAERPTKGRP